MIVKSGLEVLREQGYKPLQGLRVGLLTNPSAVDRNLDSAYHILTNADSVNITALFAPEHGFAGAVPDALKIDDYKDPLTSLPVYSLYGTNYRPTADMLKNIDVIVCDIQDIGVRYYTYVWTISHVLEAAAEHDVTVVILDRPNPLGGKKIYGATLEPEFSSFVGRYSVPVLHGLTLGELSWMINEKFNPHFARLSIIPCEHWERDMTWEATKLPWVPPSPNMPHLTTLKHYAGACLIEGTNLSEGRGTTLPFEVVGAPWIDGLKLAQHLNKQDWCHLYGTRFRPITFKPNESKFAGEYCHGVQGYIIDEQHWQPIKTWLNVIATIREMYPNDFQWLPTHPDTGRNHFDRLAGSAQVRYAIEEGIPISRLVPDWLTQSADFKKNRRPFLLYE